METMKTEEFKKELKKIKIGLEAQLKDLEKPIEMGSDIDHFEEETDEAEEFGNRLGVIQALKERLSNVSAALEKINADKYGICEKCGQEISSEVLKADPESQYCRDCKSADIN